nr:arginine--tRNA ligase, chloroplastic/mitochondrial [Tanacetum cinerariifolium]
MGEHKRSRINNGLPMPSLPSTSTSMAPSVLLVAPSITEADSDSDAEIETETETKICASQLSASIVAGRAYNMLALSTPSMAPRPIPEIYEWIQGRSTNNEQQSFIEWVCSTTEMADRDALEEYCLSVLPHILCEYLYDLCKKFNGYYSYVCKVGSLTETNTLLLCEATAAVMEKCFHLLGITPTSPFFPDQTLPKAGELSMIPLPLRLPFSAAERPMDVIARLGHTM